MSEPTETSAEAREAADSEVQEFLCREGANQGLHVQRALNNTIAAKDAEIAELRKCRDRIDKALAEMPVTGVDYSQELESCDRWIKWCEKENDTHGMNFHQGLRSGIVHGQRLHYNIVTALRAELDAAHCELSEVKAAFETSESRNGLLHNKELVLRGELSTERTAREKAEKERDEALRPCVVAIIRRGSAALLGLRQKQDSAFGKLVFPGGGIEGDESAFEALRREILEETGLQLTSATFAFTFRHGKNVYMTFECVADGEPVGSAELSNPRFYHISAIAELSLSDATRDIVLPAWIEFKADRDALRARLEEMTKAIEESLKVNREVNKLPVGNFYLAETMEGFLANHVTALASSKPADGEEVVIKRVIIDRKNRTFTTLRPPFPTAPASVPATETPTPETDTLWMARIQHNLDHPITDTNSKIDYAITAPESMLSHARSIERRLTTTLTQLAEAKRDTERLNELQKLAQKYRDYSFSLIASEAPSTTPGWKYFVEGKKGDTLREAIDSAQKGES